MGIVNSDPQLTALATSHAARLFWASSSTMLGFQLFLALLFGNGACKINLRDIVDEFKAYKGTLAQTGHLEKAKLTELTKRLKDKNHYGVVLDIQNYSGLRLVDPAVYIYGGWKDKKFGKLHPIDSSSRDAFAFHNTWRTSKIDSTHSSGVVSWLVLKPDGSPYTKMGTDGEVRLWVYWENTNWHCNHHKEPGLVAIDFLSIMHDEDGEEEDYGALDEEYHDAYFNQLERKKKEVSSSAEHHRGDLIAKVEMESKCNPVVTIKLASKKYKSPQISSQHKEAATKRTFSRPNQIVTNMPTKRSSSIPSFKLAVDQVEEVFHGKNIGKPIVVVFPSKDNHLVLFRWWATQTQTQNQM